MDPDNGPIQMVLWIEKRKAAVRECFATENAFIVDFNFLQFY